MTTTEKTTRRAILAGTAALPALALAMPAAALPLDGVTASVNATDAAWHALFAADAEHSAAYLALDDAQQAIWTEPAEPPTAALPRMTGDGEPFQLTLAELRTPGRRIGFFCPQTRRWNGPSAKCWTGS